MSLPIRKWQGYLQARVVDKPPQALQYEPHSGKTIDTKLIQPNPADFSRYEAREVVYRSADGTMVPLSIICPRNIELNGTHQPFSLVTEHTGSP